MFLLLFKRSLVASRALAPSNIGCSGVHITLHATTGRLLSVDADCQEWYARIHQSSWAPPVQTAFGGEEVESAGAFALTALTSSSH